ncbi:hypothetical protein AVEN_43886-1 [Araneus ventricosus]|uniref:RNase H type-1 domain-containing protein n=1 Tax=Araneus ventricosus TaxID=182803 RepID=A0A4Y2RBX0_ARAVE|nr:hypothetical protein AVEN_43886-1 [Araneus ventricosus]
MEQALLCSSSVWGGVLSETQIARLLSVQMICLLKFSRPFGTTPTNDEYGGIKIIDSRNKNLDLSSPVEEDFLVYTDESSLGDDVGFSVCIFDNGVLRPVFSFKLNYYITVFQVELSEINFVLCWTLENGDSIKIFSDSLSSIDVLASTSIKSNFVLNIKENIVRTNGLDNLTWI